MSYQKGDKVIVLMHSTRDPDGHFEKEGVVLLKKYNMYRVAFDDNMWSIDVDLEHIRPCVEQKIKDFLEIL